MENTLPKKYIDDITKASTYFIFRNGPLNEIYKNGKITDEELKSIQIYMQNHLSYLYKILLEENNIQKFDLIVNTMNKFFVNDDTEINYMDDGFDEMYKGLFGLSTENIKLK